MRAVRGTIAGIALALVAAPAATAASLPTVRSGARPGPPMLYSKPPSVPELSVRAPFRARPLLVSGTDAYRRGEYLYQDFLFDDRGADTVPGQGNQRDSNATFSPTAGDVFYPTDEQYSQNAADIVELRIRPTAGAIVYRVTLNTVKDADAAVVGIGIDTDRSGGAPVAWPLGAGVTSPGLDRFITAFGTGGKVTDLPGGATTDLPAGSVAISRRTNQMTIRVPRSVMDPGGASWRYVAGAGLWDGDSWMAVPPGSSPGPGRPASGSSVMPAPAVFNLAFRFSEHELQGNEPMPQYSTFPGRGHWFEEGQADVLQGGTTGDFHADVDFAKLAAGASESPHPPGRRQARIFGSQLNEPEGVHDHEDRRDPESAETASDRRPVYGGRLQPYYLSVPPDYRAGTPTPLTWSLHGQTATYTESPVLHDNEITQLGDERGSLYATTLARGPDGWYMNKSEVDFFEVWRDIARHFSLDPNRVALSGYSMGGYGTYKLGVEYPDLFGRAFTIVGPPGRRIWFPVPPSDKPPPSVGQFTNTHPRLENARWVPYMNWASSTDELVPYLGPRTQQNRFNELGLRSQLWTFTPGDHLSPGQIDEWSPARDFLGEARVDRSVSRVNYAFMPDADNGSLGLRHDHAYWVSGLRVRNRSGDPRSNPARGEIDARSLAFGEGDPLVREIATATPGPPGPATIDGRDWTSIGDAPRRNAVRITLENVGRATIDGRRARLSRRECVSVTVTSDGASRVRINLGLRGARGRISDGSFTLGPRGFTLRVPAGTMRFTVCPSGVGPRFTG